MLVSKLLVIALAVAVSLTFASTAEIKFRRDQIPKLSDALTVAKSPLEPVTLSDRLTAQLEGELPTKTTIPINVGVEDAVAGSRQTTRSVDDREKDSIDTSGSETEPNSKQTQKPDDSESNSISTTVSSESETTAAASTESELDQETTVTPVAKVIEQTEKSTTSVPVTTLQETSTEPPSSPETTEPEITTTTPATTTAEIIIPTKEQTTTTTAAPTTTTTTTTTTPAPTEAATEAATESTTPKPSTEPPTTVTFERAEEASTESDNLTNGNPVREQPEATTTTATPATEPTVAATTTKLPVSTESPVTEQLAANSVTSTATPMVLVTTESNQRSNKSENDENKSSCNHLPTYESDEIQKVFREETTYKNGTIKGKFTYINFDQRYRLVHYTRLPYGPVKIDLVEELGRPESNSNTSQTHSTSLSDIPNAVLQLRNILPNSLFGFPFLGPNSATMNNNKPTEQKEDEKSNTYFYSTDTISTPNLLSPSVPVSLLPGQRRFLKPTSSLQVSSDPLLESQIPENLQPQPKSNMDIQKLKQQEKANGDAMASLFGVPNHQQFQYALSPQGSNSPDPKQPGLIYSYMSQPHQYQYSQVPHFYSSLHHPSYFASSHSIIPHSSSYAIKVRHEHHETPISTQQYQHDQPHSHEHYIAPFMFDQSSDTSRNSNPQEPKRLQLRVKTSKSLNVDSNNNGKSAKLRASPQSSLSPPANSPATSGRLYQISPSYRHRLGKQNQELKQAINSAPIVYHILRSPTGHMYNLPQYNQAHALNYGQMEFA